MEYEISMVLTLEGDTKDVEAFQKDVLTSYIGYYDNLIETEFDCGKYYDIVEHFTEVAKRHPNVLVMLEGDGEDSDDLWEARWKGDVFELHEAKIPPFTNSALMTEREKTKLK